METISESKKEAANRRSKEWAQRNRDKVRERSRERAKLPETKAYQKAYRASRREAARECNRKWHAAHPGKARAYAAAYRARHPERARKQSRLWQRKVMGLPEATRPCPSHCELCDRVLLAGKFCLDHCHTTGVFRGWLCSSCNLALGQLGDNIAGVERAIAYLRRCEQLTKENSLA
jgi:Recombination endonuclease VII